MAVLTTNATYLQTLVASMSNIDKGENFIKTKYGFLELFGAQNSDPDSIFDVDTRQKIKGSYGNQSSPFINLSVINKLSGVAITNARSCDPVTLGLTTANVALSATTYATGFHINYSDWEGNEIKKARLMKTMLFNRIDALMAAVDGAMETELSAKKNQNWSAEVLTYYSQTGNVIQVANADLNLLFDNLRGMFNAAKFTGRVDILGNHRLLSRLGFYANQGVGNNTNYSYQFMDPTMRYFIGHTITNGAPATVESVFYAVGQGSLAYETRYSNIAKNGEKAGVKSFGMLSSLAGVTSGFGEAISINGLPFDLEVAAWDDCVDNSGSRSNTQQDKVEYFNLAVDIVLGTPYNSDPANIFRPIIQGDVLNPA